MRYVWLALLFVNMLILSSFFVSKNASIKFGSVKSSWLLYDEKVPDPVKWCSLEYSNNSVWLFETKDTFAKIRSLCAVESAAKHLSNLTIRLLTSNFTPSEDVNYLASLLKAKYPNVCFSKLDTDHFLKGSPFENYTQEYNHTIFYSIHLSDILRMAALHKYGGVYMDTDVLVLKGIQNLDANFMGRADGGVISNALIKAEKPGEKIFWKALEKAKQDYNQALYATVMFAWQKMMEEQCSRTSLLPVKYLENEVGKIDRCGNWTIYGHETGVLSRTEGKTLMLNDETESERVFAKLDQSNCSFFHWTQTYSQLQNSAVNLRTAKSASLRKVMQKSCPFVLSHAQHFK